MGSPEPVWEVVMKFKITGILLAIAGAALASFLPIPENLVGIPIFAVGVIMVALRDGQNWRNLR